MKKLFRLLVGLLLLFSIKTKLVAQSQDFSCGHHIVLAKLLKDSTFKSLYDQEQRMNTNTQHSSGAQNKGVLV